MDGPALGGGDPSKATSRRASSERSAGRHEAGRSADASPPVGREAAFIARVAMAFSSPRVARDAAHDGGDRLVWIPSRGSNESRRAWPADRHDLRQWSPAPPPSATPRYSGRSCGSNHSGAPHTAQNVRRLPDPASYLPSFESPETCLNPFDFASPHAACPVPENFRQLTQRQ